jgi:hypothetical protein
MLRGHTRKQALIITEGERYAILVDVAHVPVSRLGRPDEASGGDRDAFVLSTARTLFDLPETVTLYDLSNRYFDGEAQRPPAGDARFGTPRQRLRPAFTDLRRQSRRARHAGGHAGRTGDAGRSLGHGSMPRRFFHRLGAAQRERTICASAGALGYRATSAPTSAAIKASSKIPPAVHATDNHRPARVEPRCAVRAQSAHRQPRISAIPCAPLLRAVSSISGCSPPSA